MEWPAGRPDGARKTPSNLSHLKFHQVLQIVGMAIFLVCIGLIQFPSPRQIVEVRDAANSCPCATKLAQVSLGQELAIRTASVTSSISPTSLPAAANVPVVATASEQVDSSQPPKITGTGNISHEKVTNNPPVYDEKRVRRARRKQNTTLNQEEYTRLMLLPTSNISEALENMHKAFDACYSCLPLRKRARNIPDRRLLHDKYLPVLSSPMVKAVLSVGLRTNNEHQVEHIFRAKNPDVMFVTMEPLASFAYLADCYFGPEVCMHITDIIQNLHKYAHPLFDVALLHGVVGWGLDGETAIRESAASLYKAMAEEGLLYLWRNYDSPGDAGFPKDKSHGLPIILEYFSPYFKPFNGTWRLNPGATIDPQSEVHKGRYQGQVNILQRVSGVVAR